MPACSIPCSGPLWGFVVAFMLFNVKGTVMQVKNDGINSFVLHLLLDNNIQVLMICAFSSELFVTLFNLP